MDFQSTDMFDVFLSHAHTDAEAVETIGARLEDEAKLRVWFDRWILVPGEHWQQKMARGLEEAKTCAAFIGDHTPEGWFREEIERALNLQAKNNNFRVIPVILPGGDRGLVDDFLELRTWVDFKNGLADDHAFHVLTSGVRGVPPGRYSSPKPQHPAELDPIREKLLSIRALRQEQLIDDDIALEYQRRILDQILQPEA